MLEPRKNVIIFCFLVQLAIWSILPSLQKKKKKSLSQEYSDVRNQKEKKIYLMGALESVQFHYIRGKHYLAFKM
jgi:hypothetical protein